jgi:ammonium transporter Rh
VALPVIKGLHMENQLFGIFITIVVAFLTGLITGKVLPLLGRKIEAYDDADEFLDAAE